MVQGGRNRSTNSSSSSSLLVSCLSITDNIKHLLDQFCCIDSTVVDQNNHKTTTNDASSSTARETHMQSAESINREEENCTESPVQRVADSHGQAFEYQPATQHQQTGTITTSENCSIVERTPDSPITASSMFSIFSTEG